MELPNTRERVFNNTSNENNRNIRKTTFQSLQHYREHPELITRRLKELDQEWDVERVLELNAATVGLWGVVLSAMRGRKMLWLPAAVLVFLAQHALQGWCPPLPLFRKWGFRTAPEIEAERRALLNLWDLGRGGGEQVP